MRSLLFVPADSPRKLDKGLASGADALIVDLEDSVAPAAKATARRLAADFIAARPSGSPRLFVRINDLASGLAADDLAVVMRSRPEGIVLPKAAGGHSVQQLAAMLRVVEAELGIADGSTAILPIITETPAALFAGGTYAGASARLAGLTWGAEDLSASIGAQTPRDEDCAYTDVYRLARAVALLAASAAEVAPVDTVFIDFRDERGLRDECRRAARDGFVAKMAIHPAQVAVINEAFTPSLEALKEAAAVVAAFTAAGDAGVVAIGGRMFDRPHLRRAQRLLARAVQPAQGPE